MIMDEEGHLGGWDSMDGNLREILELVGREKAIVELLGRLFERRIGRQPTSEEKDSIVERAYAIGPGKVEDALLDLDANALIRWLAEPVR